MTRQTPAEKKRERERQRTYRRRDAGKCSRCAADAMPGRWSCAECQRRNTLSQRVRRRARGAAADLVCWIERASVGADLDLTEYSTFGWSNKGTSDLEGSTAQAGNTCL